VVALLEGVRRGVDRPEGGDGHCLDVLQALEVTRRRRTLQLLIRARVSPGEVRVACGVCAGKSQHRVEVEAAGGGRQSALDGPGPWRRGRGGRSGPRGGRGGCGGPRGGRSRRTGAHQLPVLTLPDQRPPTLVKVLVRRAHRIDLCLALGETILALEVLLARRVHPWCDSAHDEYREDQKTRSQVRFHGFPSFSPRRTARHSQVTGLRRDGVSIAAELSSYGADVEVFFRVPFGTFSVSLRAP